jgi:hypothetical protein
MRNTLSNQLMRAALARFESDRQAALATIELYLTVPVGVGEHPNIVEEIAAAARKLAEAEEGLDTLTRNFLGESPEKVEEENV